MFMCSRVMFHISSGQRLTMSPFHESRRSSRNGNMGHVSCTPAAKVQQHGIPILMRRHFCITVVAERCLREVDVVVLTPSHDAFGLYIQLQRGLLSPCSVPCWRLPTYSLSW